ncbi:MAG: DUF6482 family protein [Pseudomonadota bacterium]
MKLPFKQFRALEPCDVIVHSLDQALYQVIVMRDNREHLLVEDDGRPFRRHSLQEVVEVLRLMPVASALLRQRSAYDEMIGQPPREGDNVMELPLHLDQAPPITRH